MTLGPAVLIWEGDLEHGLARDSIKISLVHDATILSWYTPSEEVLSRICVVKADGTVLPCFTLERNYSSMFLEAVGSSLWEISRSGMPIDTRVQKVCVPGVSM